MRSGPSDLLLGAFLIGTMVTAGAAQAAGVYVQPANLYLEAAAGTVIEEQLRIAPTESGTPVHLSLSSFTIDEQGRPGSCRCRSDRSIVTWSELTAYDLLLSTGNYVPVTLRMTIPSTASGTYWGAVMIDVEAGSAPGATVRSRVALPVFVTVAGTEVRHLTVSNLSAYTSAEGVIVTGAIRNAGNTVFHGPLVVALENASAEPPLELAAIDDALVTVLPGGSRIFRLNLSGRFGPAGPLRVTAWLRFGADRSGVSEASCGVAPDPPCEGVCLGM